MIKTRPNINLQCEKINYNPLVMVNQLFEPIKFKTGIVGFWKDKTGKIYIDNIARYIYPAINQNIFNTAKKVLFSKGEKAVFYKNYYNEGIIETATGEKVILKNRIAWTQKSLSIKFIKLLLSQHEGFTIYRLKDNKYLIEIYK